LKRVKLSSGPGLADSSPAKLWSQWSKPTYFFHCFIQRTSTRYLGGDEGGERWRGERKERRGRDRRERKMRGERGEEG
jgi:hypothetical protein